MSRSKWALGALTALLLIAQPALAQDEAVSFAVRAGGFNALTNLDEPGTTDFKQVGFNVGGTVGVDLNPYVGLRGDFTFARNGLQQNDVETGDELDRFFYDASLQVRYPAASGWTPYAFVGAGAVTLNPVESADDAKTKAAGTVGLGLEYAIPGSNFGLGVEGKGWLYGLSDLNGPLSGFDRNQFEVTWSAGLSYRLPFGSSGDFGGR